MTHVPEGQADGNGTIFIAARLKATCMLFSGVTGQFLGEICEDACV